MTGVVQWVSGIVFKPSVWLGFGLLGVAWLLLMTTRAVERRGGGTRKERKAAAAAQREAVAPTASAPSLATGRAPAAQPVPKANAKPAASEDFSDIEAILKKHGI